MIKDILIKNMNIFIIFKGEEEFEFAPERYLKY